MINKSKHKNYIKWYNWDIDSFVNEIILKNKNLIFLLISEKLKKDSEKDLETWKVKIANWWRKASKYAKDIHILFGDIEYNIKNRETENIVEEFINMDYNSVWIVFDKIWEKFKDNGNTDIVILVENIKIEILKMREISKKYTIIENK